MNNTRPDTIAADVVIIGGGLAGLSAAYELTGTGLQVHLLEASARLGGRTWGHFWDQAQQHIDLGASWLTPHFKNALEFVEKFGLTTVETPTPDQYLTHFSAGVAHQRFPSPGEFAGLHDVSCKMRNALTAADRTLATAHDALTDTAMSDFSRDWHIAMQRYLAGANLQRVDPQHLLLDMEDFIDPEHYNIEIQGSMKQIVTALARSIDASIHRSTPVAAVKRRGEIYEVLTSQNEIFHASSVVLAVPLNVLKHIKLDAREVGPLCDFIPDGHPGASRKDWFVLDGVDSHMRVFASSGIFGYLRTAARLDTGSMLAVGLAPAHEGSPTLSQFETEIRRYIPTAKVEAHYSFDWNAYPWAAGTWVTPPPGYYEALAQLDNTASTFQIAGGDFSSDFPGTVEGAIMTGRQAANNLRQHHL